MTPSDAAGHPQTASERLAAALGRPAPRKLTDVEAREFERRQDEVDAQIERTYGQRRAA